MNLAPEFDRRFVETPFRQTTNGTAFRTFGDGEPLVLMHGVAGSWERRTVPRGPANCGRWKC